MNVYELRIYIYNEFINIYLYHSHHFYHIEHILITHMSHYTFIIFFIMFLIQTCKSFHIISNNGLRFMRTSKIVLSNTDTNNILPSLINTKIKKTESKVVDTIECINIAKDTKLVMCRCWKSEKFPYCDGAHVKYNNESGDNVGPLIIKN